MFDSVRNENSSPCKLLWTCIKDVKGDLELYVYD